MPVAVGDIVRLTAKMRLFGTEDVQNIYTYRVDRNATTSDAAFMTQAALHMDTAYTKVNGDMTINLSYASVDGFNITKNELLPDTPWPVLTIGLTSFFMLPTQVAGFVFWPTTAPKVRTSAFVGGYTVASNTAVAELTPPTIANLNLFGLDLRFIITVDIDATKGSFKPIGSIFTPSGLPQVPVRWRTQRRRRVGVGS